MFMNNKIFTLGLGLTVMLGGCNIGTDNTNSEEVETGTKV